MKTKELDWTGTVQIGAKGIKARRIQEWLTLQGFAIDIDSDFGPATGAALRGFQLRCGLPVTAVVDEPTFVRLTAPMRDALRPIPRNGRRLGELVVAYAEQQLAQSPREVGGDNRGPWVRLYNGTDGKDQKWCAGFVSTILAQACESLGTAPPIEPSVSCDALAKSAKSNNRFLAGKDAQNDGGLQPGTFFIQQSRTNTKDWTHTGIVTRSNDDLLFTIEGNTDHGGSSNGFEATARTRGWVRKDFIRI